MSISFAPSRCIFIGRNVRHFHHHHLHVNIHPKPLVPFSFPNQHVVSNRLHRIHPRCTCSGSQQQQQTQKLTSRERRKASVQARLLEHIKRKKELEENPRERTCAIVMIPSYVRERCNLNNKLSRVKIFLDGDELIKGEDDITNINITKLREQIRTKLVAFYPELEQRKLFSESEKDDFEIRINGKKILKESKNEDIIMNIDELYIEVIPPSNKIPAEKTPLSHKVDEVRNKIKQNEYCDLCMISFYKFVKIDNPLLMSSILSKTWSWLGIKGRVYIASEGINAQLAVPENVMEEFKQAMKGDWKERNEYVIPELFHDVYLNVDRITSYDLQPFEKLHVKPREKILADGFEKPLNWNKAGKEIKPGEWHDLVSSSSESDDNAIILDCRNDYESDVGRFDGALPLNTSTFRETWDKLETILKDQPKDKPILSYCTGGIRCVKVNAYLEQKMGFTNTGRLSGGIVSYTRHLRNNNENNKAKSLFKGVNHVFDGRMGEVVTEDLLDNCANCGQPCNFQTDCANVLCPRSFDRRIFVQCEECSSRLNGACSNECQKVLLSTSSTNEYENQWKTSIGNLSLSTSPSSSRDISDDEVYADSFSSSSSSPDYQLILDNVKEKTRQHFPNRIHIMSSPCQAQFLKLLVQITNAQNILEIGTFTGYATLCMAEGIAAQGNVTTCEKDNTAADIAQACFNQRTTQESQRVNIQLVRGDAIDYLKSLSVHSSFDMAFVDADKGGYIGYVQTLLDRQLVPVGGLIVIDNVLFRGEVSKIWRAQEVDAQNHEQVTEQDTDAARKRIRNIQNVRKTAKKLHAFNGYLHSEVRLQQVLLPFRDGLTIARRIG